MPPQNTMNDGLLAYLGVGKHGARALLPGECVADPYMGCGCHPDIVARLWDEIGPALPEDSRFIVGGRPSLVHAKSGVVIAVALGTQYALRLAAEQVPIALGVGAKTSTVWSGGGILDVADTLGPSWILGGWFKQEPAWCNFAFRWLGENAV